MAADKEVTAGKCGEKSDGGGWPRINTRLAMIDTKHILFIRALGSIGAF